MSERDNHTNQNGKVDLDANGNEMGWRFEKRINLGHVLVVLGLCGNIIVLAYNYGKNMVSASAIINEHERRLAALENTMAKVVETQYYMKENITVLTELVRRLETIVDRQERAKRTQ